MFVVGKNGKILNEANEKALTPVCTVQVQKIFALLHAQAVQAAEKAGVVIENTAADGNDAKTAVFHSAGEHMIVARLKDGKIDRKTALDGIKAYVKVFCGEDVSNALKEEECFPLPDEPDEGSDENDGDDSGEGEDGEESVDESIVPSFRMYLSESTGLNVILEADEDDDGGDSEGQDQSGDSDGKEDKDRLASGWYVLYGLKIKGLKETTVQDALKQWGSNFLKGFGVTLGSMWGGGGGQAHTIGGLVKGLRAVFGAISDPDKLETEIKDKLSKKFPQLSISEVEFRDKKTLIADLEKTHRVGFDGKAKQKINSAEYSLYIHVEKDDPKKPFLNRKILANMVTLSISGLFKKFKNKVSADDIIYLQGSSLDKTGHDSEYRDAIIPTPDALDDIIETYKDRKPGKIWLKFDAIFDKIVKNKKLENDEQAKSFKDLWTKFKKDHKESSKNVTNVGEYENFLEDYTKAYSARQTNEDINADVSSIFDRLFENGSVGGDVMTELAAMEPLCSVFEVDGDKPEDMLPKEKVKEIAEKLSDKVNKLANTIAGTDKSAVRFFKNKSGDKFIGQQMRGKVDIPVGFGPVDTGIACMKEYGILKSDVESAAGKHKYMFILPLRIPEKRKWGKSDKETYKGDPGYEAFDEQNVKGIFQDVAGMDLADFMHYKQDANANFVYYGTDVPGHCDIYVGFIDAAPGETPPEPGDSDKEVYFAVTEDPLSPDPKKVKKLLNDGKPVKQKDITDELLTKLREEAEAFVEDESLINEAEDDDDSEEDADGEGEGDASFVGWEPDPKTASDPNSEVEGKPAIIICAKFKKDEPGEDPDDDDPKPTPNPTPKPGEGQAGGDDLYIIPMPGVKYDDTDDEGFTKTM